MPANPKNYVVKIKAGLSNVSLPGEGVRFTAGDEVEVTPAQFRQFKAAHLAKVDVIQGPQSEGGLSQAQLDALATDTEVATAISSKQDAATAATDSEVDQAIAGITAVVATDTELASAVSAAVTALKAASMGVVTHGADGTVARPTGFAAIYWKGTVEPVNATDDDLWVGGA